MSCLSKSRKESLLLVLSFTSEHSRALRIFGAKVLTFGYQSDFIFKWTNMYKEERKVEMGFYELGDDVMSEKEKIYAENPSLLTPADELTSSKPQLFINQLYKVRAELTTDEIRDEINTLVITVTKTNSR
jgi:hypothetical protein